MPIREKCLECLEMPEGVGVAGLAADGRGRFFCGGVTKRKSAGDLPVKQERFALGRRQAPKLDS